MGKWLKATKDEQCIKTTQKMFNTVYRAQGFVLEEDADPGAQEPTPLSEMTVDELRLLAKKAGIKGVTKLKTPELITLLTPKEDESDGDGQSGEGQQGDGQLKADWQKEGGGDGGKSGNGGAD